MFIFLYECLSWLLLLLFVCSLQRLFACLSVYPSVCLELIRICFVRYMCAVCYMVYMHIVLSLFIVIFFRSLSLVVSFVSLLVLLLLFYFSLSLSLSSFHSLSLLMCFVEHVTEVVQQDVPTQRFCCCRRRRPPQQDLWNGHACYQSTKFCRFAQAGKYALMSNMLALCKFL